MVAPLTTCGSEERDGCVACGAEMIGETATGAAITGAAPDVELLVRGPFGEDEREDMPDELPPLRPPCCGAPTYGVTSITGWFSCDPGTVGKEGAWTIS
jgi:hypothetical protein